MRISISYLYTIFKYGYPHSVDLLAGYRRSVERLQALAGELAIPMEL